MVPVAREPLLVLVAVGMILFSLPSLQPVAVVVEATEVMVRRVVLVVVVVAGWVEPAVQAQQIKVSQVAVLCLEPAREQLAVAAAVALQRLVQRAQRRGR